MKGKEKARRSIATLLIVGLLVVTSGFPQKGEASDFVTVPISALGSVVFAESGCTGWPIAYYPLMGYTQASRDVIAAGNPRARSVRVLGFCHNLNPNPDLSNNEQIYAYERPNCRGPMHFVQSMFEVQEGDFSSYQKGPTGSCESTILGRGNPGRWW